jgi:hypothetical protein
MALSLIIHAREPSKLSKVSEKESPKSYSVESGDTGLPRLRHDKLRRDVCKKGTPTYGRDYDTESFPRHAAETCNIVR